MLQPNAPRLPPGVTAQWVNEPRIRKGDVKMLPQSRAWQDADWNWLRKEFGNDIGKIYIEVRAARGDKWVEGLEQHFLADSLADAKKYAFGLLADGSADSVWIEGRLTTYFDSKFDNRRVYDFGLYEKEVPMRSNPRVSTVDETAADELKIYIDNTAELMGPGSQGEAIRKNLRRKIKNGTFDFEKSVQGWMYVVEAGAKMYNKEFGTGETVGSGSWHEVFSVPTRKAVAREIAEEFYSEAKLGNYDHIVKPLLGRLPHKPNQDIQVGDTVQFRFEPGTGGVIERFENGAGGRLIAWVSTRSGLREVPADALRHVRHEHEERVRSMTHKPNASRRYNSYEDQEELAPEIAGFRFYDDEKTGMVVMVDDEGRVVYLVNPLEVPRGRTYAGVREERPIVLWFGAHAPTRLFIWARSLEDALEMAGDTLAEHFPGLIMQHDDPYLKELYDEAREELGPDADDGEVYQQAEADLTYTESGYITSYEWGIDSDPGEGHEWKEATEAGTAMSRILYKDEYGEEA